MQKLKSALAEVLAALKKMDIRHALVGGLAVTIRATERTTKDIDLAISVQSDIEAERVVKQLLQQGFVVESLLENKTTKRLGTARLASTKFPGVLIDLLFAASGIENEVVNAATPIEIFPGLVTNVATISSLIAMKLLSANDSTRITDIGDLYSLIKEASQNDLFEAKDNARLIMSRGFNRKKDLVSYLDELIEHLNSSDK